MITFVRLLPAALAVLCAAACSGNAPLAELGGSHPPAPPPAAAPPVPDPTPAPGLPPVSTGTAATASGAPAGGGTTRPPDSPAAVAAAAGMSPDDVAVYCRQTGEFAAIGTPEELSSPFYFNEAAKSLVDLKAHTPAQLTSDIALLDTDYHAVSRQDRVFVQVKDEVDAAFGRVMSFRHSICDLG